MYAQEYRDRLTEERRLLQKEEFNRRCHAENKAMFADGILSLKGNDLYIWDRYLTTLFVHNDYMNGALVRCAVRAIKFVKERYDVRE